MGTLKGDAKTLQRLYLYYKDDKSIRHKSRARTPTPTIHPTPHTHHTHRSTVKKIEYHKKPDSSSLLKIFREGSV